MNQSGPRRVPSDASSGSSKTWRLVRAMPIIIVGSVIVGLGACSDTNDARVVDSAIEALHSDEVDVRAEAARRVGSFTSAEHDALVDAGVLRRLTLLATQQELEPARALLALADRLDVASLGELTSGAAHKAEEVPEIAIPSISRAIARGATVDAEFAEIIHDRFETITMRVGRENADNPGAIQAEHVGRTIDEAEQLTTLFVLCASVMNEAARQQPVGAMPNGHGGPLLPSQRPHRRPMSGTFSEEIADLAMTTIWYASVHHPEFYRRALAEYERFGMPEYVTHSRVPVDPLRRSHNNDALSFQSVVKKLRDDIDATRHLDRKGIVRLALTIAYVAEAPYVEYVGALQEIQSGAFSSRGEWVQHMIIDMLRVPNDALQTKSIEWLRTALSPEQATNSFITYFREKPSYSLELVDLYVDFLVELNQPHGDEHVLAALRTAATEAGTPHEIGWIVKYITLLALDQLGSSDAIDFVNWFADDLDGIVLTTDGRVDRELAFSELAADTIASIRHRNQLAGQ